MRILMIRHAKVDMPWKKKYNAQEYDQAWRQYDECDILPAEKRMEVYPGAKVFVSSLKRTHQTAQQYLGVRDYTVPEHLLDEVPLRSFADVRRRFPRHMMDAVAQLQWLLSSKRQPERRGMTRERAERMIDCLEEQGDGDYVLVTHGFFVRMLVAALRRWGYSVRNRRILFTPNLCAMEAIRR